MGILAYASWMRGRNITMESNSGYDHEDNFWSLRGIITNHVFKWICIYLIFIKKDPVNYKWLLIAKILFAIGFNSFILYHY